MTPNPPQKEKDLNSGAAITISQLLYLLTKELSGKSWKSWNYDYEVKGNSVKNVKKMELYI
jgi:hypothetical protein